MKSSFYDLSRSRFTVQGLKDSALLALKKVYKKGPFPLSPPLAKGDLGGFVLMAQYKSPQSPLLQRGATVATFFKGGYGGNLFQRGLRWQPFSKGAAVATFFKVAQGEAFFKGDAA